MLFSEFLTRRKRRSKLKTVYAEFFGDRHPQLDPQRPAPNILAAEIVEDLQAALEQFAEIAEDLGGT